MDKYKTEVIFQCAETNGPCWECAVQEECMMWEEEMNDLTFCKDNKNHPTIISATNKE